MPKNDGSRINSAINRIFNAEAIFFLCVAIFSLMVGGWVFFSGVMQKIEWNRENLHGGFQWVIAVITILAMVLSIFKSRREEIFRKEKIEEVEERARENPEKPQLAWDLARTKLESYLDRNLAQVRSIYWLTLLVMIAGFSFIIYGLLQAFDKPELLPVAIVASASGIIVSFIGGSLLLIYRSILAQSSEYVSVLERINAVGMAVQVIANIPEGGENLRDQTTADIAKQLLGLYATPPKRMNKP